MAFIKQVSTTGNEAPVAKRKEINLHQELVLRGERWMRSRNCGVVIRDPFRSYNREQPDVLGWRDGVSLLIEVKVSRADFLADANKPFRIDPSEGMGDWRFYLCPPGIIKPDDLPSGWGLLYAKEKIISAVSGVPGNGRWHTAKPFTGNKNAENIVLYAALRRLTLRGYLPEVYDGPIGAKKNER